MSEDSSHGSNNLIPLGQSTQLDLTPLSETDRTEIVRRFAEGKIELAKKAGELAVENQALAQRLDGMVKTVTRASDTGASASVTGAYNDKMGRTEVIMGNTETAAKGKLSRSQTGEKDLTLVYVIVAAVVVVIIAALCAR
jgi:hypothetical protein